MTRDKYGLIVAPDTEYVECEFCGIDFAPTHGNEKFCGHCELERKREYRRLYYRTYKREGDPMNPLEGRTCEHCGEGYDALAGNQKHCKRCQRLVRNERSLALYYERKALGQAAGAARGVA